MKLNQKIIIILLGIVVVISGIGIAYAQFDRFEIESPILRDNTFGGNSTFGQTNGPEANVADGINAVAFGYGTNAQAYSSFVLGKHNEIAGNSNTWFDADPLFVIGIGADGNNRQNAFTILKNGNIGIGNSNPTELLSIQSSSTPRLEIIDTTNSVTMIVDARNNNGVIGTTSDNNLRIFTNNNEKMRVQAGGNVGIGTTNPNSLLEISGGYLKLETVTDEPPASDCDNSNEYGRIIADSTNGYIYVCEQGGWHSLK